MGATTSVSSPFEMESHAPSCTGVGAAKAPVNHSRVAGCMRRSTAAGVGTPPLNPMPPTHPFVTAGYAAQIPVREFGESPKRSRHCEPIPDGSGEPDIVPGVHIH
ncbi:hypothetical protein nbrc107696_24550 [Gordonia spumicola]|uniref:Uncharacterized protein n=1 Tax=Gordonia spumicola TaxID=589161 RepID=A0A7I9V9L2_9ACTN|nr:hypothetical protein nbrc107696_24550 [Gordonia spumicola]